MLADNNYNASALFWYTQRYHAEPRTEDRVPLASAQGPIGGYLAFSGALTVSTGRGGAPLIGACVVDRGPWFMEG